MTTTISGSTITFVDGSTWTGAAGGVTPDTNSSNTAVSYQLGYLAFANTVFSVNGGFMAAGVVAWGLSRSNYSHTAYDAATNPAGVYLNTLNAVNSYLGSQNFYISVNTAAAWGTAAGTWRGRGQAVNTGLYQYLGNFVLLERVA